MRQFCPVFSDFKRWNKVENLFAFRLLARVNDILEIYFAFLRTIIRYYLSLLSREEFYRDALVGTQHQIRLQPYLMHRISG